MGKHHQIYRQCTDCYHWIGHVCQIQPPPASTQFNGKTLNCKAFVRGSLIELFRARDSRTQTLTPR